MRNLGLIGLGAFGQLMVKHLSPYFRIHAWDADPFARRRAARRYAVRIAPLEAVAAQRFVVLAAPVQALEAVARDIAPFVRPGVTVLDVCSVKVRPAEILTRALPPQADILATHPMFGPQSAADGIGGKEIVLCPVRGDRWRRVAVFLERALRLKVSVTTPEQHDRDVAAVQGLTHLIAKVITRMGDMPARHHTDSFSLLMQAARLVEGDSDALFRAIQQMNPYAPELTERFFRLGDALREELAHDGEALAVRAANAEDGAQR